MIREVFSLIINQPDSGRFQDHHPVANISPESVLPVGPSVCIFFNSIEYASVKYILVRTPVWRLGYNTCPVSALQRSPYIGWV